MPKHLPVSLLLLRLSVFLVIFMWTLDKFLNPGHASAIFEHFYFISGIESSIMYVIGTLEICILLAFLVGFLKKYSYGAILLFHSVSTFSSYNQYFSPFEGTNLLFFAAWPMLAACLVLFLLRDADTLLTVKST